MVTVYVTAVIFVAVGSVLAYATIRFKARSAAAEHAEPPAQSHGNRLVEMGLVSASVLCLVVIAIPTLRAIIYTYDMPAGPRRPAPTRSPPPATQWWFQVRVSRANRSPASGRW